MNRVKRWTMTSWVDGVLAQIENHEANVDAAIVRVRKPSSKAPSKPQPSALLAGGAAVLIPLLWAAFRTLLRSHAGRRWLRSDWGSSRSPPGSNVGRARLESNEAKSLLGNLSILRFLQSRAIDTFLISLASTSTYTIFGFSVPNGFSTNLCRPDESVSRRGVLPSNFFPS
jgi:hypothetical protein